MRLRSAPAFMFEPSWVFSSVHSQLTGHLVPQLTSRVRHCDRVSTLLFQWQLGPAQPLAAANSGMQSSCPAAAQALKTCHPVCKHGLHPQTYREDLARALHVGLSGNHVARRQVLRQ